MSKGFFYWSDGVEVDNSILDLRGDIVSVFRSYVSTDTEIKYGKQRLQCLQWLAYIFRGHLPRERVHVEIDYPDDEAKLEAFFGIKHYLKRKRRMELIINQIAEKEFCDVSKDGVLSRISRLRSLLGKLMCMKEWKATLGEEECFSMELQHSAMKRNTKPPGVCKLD